MEFIDKETVKSLTGIYRIKNIVNNILSNDAWRSVVVDGWDEFQRCRKHVRGHPVAGRYKIQNK